MSLHFHKGDQVEVMKQVNGVNTLTYFSATVLGSPSFLKGKILIEFNCSLICDPDSGKPLRETVDLACLRPMPPKQDIECFKLGDSVDVFCDNGWQKGTVRDLLENSKYVVGFDGKSLGVVAEQCDLRLHRDWDDGSWFPPFTKISSDKEMKPRKFRIKIKCRKRVPVPVPVPEPEPEPEPGPGPEPEPEPEPIFKTGTRVEVRSDEEGYIGAWYDATIVGIIGNDKYIVKYLNLLTNDETALIKETVTYNNIRPCPPLVRSQLRFQQFEYVDAWFNDGWWEGMVLKVLNDFKYIVYFSPTNETIEFEHSSLRHHQEWINGDWKRKEKSVKFGDNKRKLTEKFGIGAKVEVKSDEVGYQGAWFGATIVDVMESGSFLVQYDNLLTEDGADYFKEVANDFDVRPSPPLLQHEHSYRVPEMVDAWYNDGWWVGRIKKVYRNSKYLVHFNDSEELRFEQCELRPHQEYIDGNWIITPMQNRQW